MLIKIHDCIPALVWPNTGQNVGSCCGSTATTEGFVFSQNLQTAIFAAPFSASDEFETKKNCKI